MRFPREVHQRRESIYSLGRQVPLRLFVRRRRCPSDTSTRPKPERCQNIFRIRTTAPKLLVLGQRTSFIQKGVNFLGADEKRGRLEQG